MRDSSIPLATKVGSAGGNAKDDHFSTLLNRVKNDASKTSVCESIESGVSNEDAIVVTSSEVQECLKSIKVGKAAGVDGLAAEHFVFDIILYVFMCRCYMGVWVFTCGPDDICYCTNV